MYNSTVTPLQDGTILLAGGFYDLVISGVTYQRITSAAYIFDPLKNQYTPTKGTMTVGRAMHLATLLNDGKVLIAGGELEAGSSGPINYWGTSAELYDPVSQTFSSIGSMKTQHTGGTSTLLQDGTVLLAGGGMNYVSMGTSVVASAEIYSPTSGTFSSVDNMVTPRAGHTATLLPGGSVLFTGGFTPNNNSRSAEIYIPSSPLSGHFSAVSSLNVPRAFHQAVLLTNGNVLIVGGFSSWADVPTSSAEMYNPSTLSFSSIGSMHQAKAQFAASALRDGTVLVAGGIFANDGECTGEAEIYDPMKGTFSTTASLVGGITCHSFDKALMSNGKIFLYNGGSNTDIYAYPFTAGAISPKYIVLGVIYSPPGAGSTVDYTNTTALGTETDIKSSFESGTTITTTYGINGGMDGISGSISGTNSNTWTQKSDTTETYNVSKTKTSDIVATGPLSSSIGVDHDYDAVLVWLNPKINLTVGQNTTNILWNGYSYDSNDYYSPNGMDIVSLSLVCLKNPFLSPSCTANNYRTSRPWDTSGNGGLTLNDYNTIAQRDPFFDDPNYDPNNDSNQRFTYSSNVLFQPSDPVSCFNLQIRAMGHIHGRVAWDTRSRPASANMRKIHTR